MEEDGVMWFLKEDGYASGARRRARSVSGGGKSGKGVSAMPPDEEDVPAGGGHNRGDGGDGVDEAGPSKKRKVAPSKGKGRRKRRRRRRR